MISENLDAFYADFAYTAIILATGGTVTTPGIFDSEFLPMMADSYSPVPTGAVEGRRVSLRVITSRIQGVRHGDQVSIEGKGNWIVIGIEPAEDGANTDLILKEAT